ncbi:ATP-dependent helicase HrpB [Cryptosporangium phraense]|uniref:RNA helicase n=1 Tax=Cryptosporangium phraense TaxID=2593070 RepID=A0A545APP7_9ACTN|nr:ATP-dependent helicase HrpB [Cryptosporangium phraense]TQS43297.1 ATP-dependent helicase HrpB [Cryptosporangium phraense]
MLTLPDLPVRPALPRIVDALADGGAAVLVAPPGSGKTTLVPLALAAGIDRRIVVAEPRRVAARAAAARMASLLGERVGETVGYTVRGDRTTGPRTRIDVVTTGVLVRRLQRDPELPGVGAVILDEIHERHLDSNLALAFTQDARGTLRPDLSLLATSATVASERLSELLGGPVLEVPGSPHPVRTVWCPPPVALQGRTDPRLLDHVAAVVRRALSETDGDLLVFLPGAAEIGGVSRRLGSVDATVAVLHGRLASRDQDAVLRPAAGRRRIVLATAVAESSLTVPGVRVVVDAGLARVPRMDQGRGLGALVTVPESRATATQRAGRAGREAPGTVYRCWSEADHARMPAWPEPEIAAADLTPFALDLACWGTPSGEGLALPDPPPPAAMEVARTTLRALGALDTDGRVTPRGRTLATMGVHPRLARALLDGGPVVGPRRAAEVVALLADDTLTSGASDLTAAWRVLRDGSIPDRARRWRDEAGRLAASAREADPAAPADRPAGERGPAAPVDRRSPAAPVGRRSPAAAGLPDDLAAGLIVGMAYPERLALRRADAGRSYLMAGGTAADLAEASSLGGTRWLAIAVADRSPGHANARIRLAVAIDEATAVDAGSNLLTTEDEIRWDDGELLSRRIDKLGAIPLAERAIDPDVNIRADAVLAGVKKEGLNRLRWDTDARVLRERLAFAHAALGPPWPAMDDGTLLDRAAEWLGPDLTRVRRRADLAKVDAGAALRRLLPWPEAARLDELVPERLAVPSGSKIRVDYRDPAAPVLAVKVQEAFGWTATPTVAGVPVRLHLLSPAGRPVAVTSDLESFWRTGYPSVRAELRGRYPKHPWPDDPTTATPTRRTTRPR